MAKRNKRDLEARHAPEETWVYDLPERSQAAQLDAAARASDATGDAGNASEYPIVITWDRIHLERLVDRGTTGWLFRARLDNRSEPFILRRHAIQYLALHNHKELVTQLQKLRALEHPNLLAVAGLVTDGMRNVGTLMEFLPRSLARILANSETSEKTSNTLRMVWLSLVEALVSALVYLHSHGIGHHAVHPKNILFDASLTLKLSDYGRSRKVTMWQMEEEQELLRASGTGELPRTRLYLAPEMLRQEHLTHAADVWSVSCVIARLASLRPLYGNATASMHIIMMRIACGELSPADQLTEAKGFKGSQALIDLVRSCASLEPERRPSMADVQRALKRNDVTALARSGSAVPTAAALPAPSSDSLKRSSASSQAPAINAAGMRTPESHMAATETSSSRHNDSVLLDQPSSHAVAKPTKESLHRAFVEYDEDKSGDLNARELCRALNAFGLGTNEAEAKRIIGKYDNIGCKALNAEQFEKVLDSLRRFKAMRERRKVREGANTLQSGHSAGQGKVIVGDEDSASAVTDLRNLSSAHSPQRSPRQTHLQPGKGVDRPRVASVSEATPVDDEDDNMPHLALSTQRSHDVANTSTTDQISTNGCQRLQYAGSGHLPCSHGSPRNDEAAPSQPIRVMQSPANRDRVGAGVAHVTELANRLHI